MRPTEVKDDGWCFACGPENPQGLHLGGFRFENGDCVCEFTPERHHQSWVGITHGGILTTLLDEMMLHAIRARGGQALTGELTVRFKAPVEIGTTMHIRARVVSQRKNLIVTQGEVRLPDGRIAAQADAKFMSVD